MAPEHKAGQQGIGLMTLTMRVGNYITFSNNMELILKLHVNCLMLFILNFVINFNPGCAVKFGYNCMLVKFI